MIDSDYDEESFFVRHCYFSGGSTDPYARLMRALRAEIDEQATQVGQDRHQGDQPLRRRGPQVFEIES